MFVNPRSAVLQLLSTANYLFDDPGAVMKGATSGNYQEAAKRILTSPWFKERGRGKIDVALADLFAQDSKTPAGKLIDQALEKGYFLTKLGDKGAILTGGAPYMAGKHSQYVAQGMESEAAWNQAYKDYVRQSEEAQQSTRAERLGSQQTTATGKFILAFANTPMQYNRKISKAVRDIKGYGITHPRGRQAAVRIAYYGAAQNMVFNMLQQLSFAAIGLEGDDDEGDEAFRTWNSVFNTLLRGAGIYGAAFAAIKDAYIAVVKDGRKGLGAVDQAIGSISPAASTKVRHLRTVLGDRDPKMESTLELSKSTYQIAAAAEFLNIPANRVLKLIEQAGDLSANDLDDFEKIARFMGWSRYNLDKQLGKAEGEGILTPSDEYY